MIGLGKMAVNINPNIYKCIVFERLYDHQIKKFSINFLYKSNKLKWTPKMTNRIQSEDVRC